MTRAEPGLYRTTQSLTGYTMADPTPADEEWARANLPVGVETRGEHCITAEQAERGYLPVVEALGEGMCRTTRFDVDGDRLDAAVACEETGGTTLQFSLALTAGATSSRMESRVVQSGERVPGKRLELVRLSESERIGECPTPPPPQAAPAQLPPG